MTDPGVVQNVIFDLGGVVFDWNPDAIVREVTDDVGYQQLLMREVLGHPDWLELDRGVLMEAEAVGRFARRTNRSIEDMTAMMRVIDRLMQPKPVTLSLMQDLAARGFTLYCLSNMPVERYAYLRRTYDFWDLFTGIVISGHVKLIKPQPEIYTHRLATYGLIPSACLFLDDMPHNVESARAAGMQSLVFTTAGACRAALAPLFDAGGL